MQISKQEVKSLFFNNLNNNPISEDFKHSVVLTVAEEMLVMAFFTCTSSVIFTYQGTLLVIIANLSPQRFLGPASLPQINV